jgi:hypothetical protein
MARWLQREGTNNEAMKTLVKIAMILLLGSGAWMMPKNASAQFPGISYQVFYDQLSPYGAWIYDDNYGYVWIPDVMTGFYPYGTNGHWVYTDYGWTWVSYYAWGWAPFHYGRWNFDPYYGWLWVPGNEWGPAWVTWRRCNDYYGWAPLGPGITIQMTFNINFFIPDDRWMFVRGHDFDRPDLDRYYVGRRENHDLVRQARTIENTRVDNRSHVTYGTGPNEREIGKVTGRQIKPMPVAERTDPGKTSVDRGKLEIYRPPVVRNDTKGREIAPGKVTAREDIKPVSERRKGDMTFTKTNSGGTNRATTERVQPAETKSTPKYDRSGVNSQNQNRIQQPPNETKQQSTNRQYQQPPSETKQQPTNRQYQQPPKETRQQPTERQSQQPPKETRQQPSEHKQLGAPDHSAKPAPQPAKTNSGANRTEENHKGSSGENPRKVH